MSNSEEIAGRLADALIDGDGDLAEEFALEALKGGADPVALINDVMIPALTVVGDQFQNGEVFLPELMLAGDAAQRVSQHVEAAIASQGRVTEPKGTVVIGTVMGDIHDIGKNIVVTMLKAHGFRVVDLGRNVAPSGFLTAAQENRAQVVAMSSLMTTTRPMIENTINLFSEVGVRDNFKMIVGGGCVTDEWASTLGADGYSPDAVGAVDLCKKFSA